MSTRVRELAALFDRAFAEPAASERERGTGALDITAGGAPYLLPLAKVVLVARAPKLVPLPQGDPRQLGIAGIRGSLFTVFSLTALLGDPVTSGEWIAVLTGGIAIAFDALDGQRELHGAPPNLLDVDVLLARVRT